jgi:hypothetical protein
VKQPFKIGQLERNQLKIFQQDIQNNDKDLKASQNNLRFELRELSKVYLVMEQMLSQNDCLRGMYCCEVKVEKWDCLRDLRAVNADITLHYAYLGYGSERQVKRNSFKFFFPAYTIIYISYIEQSSNYSNSSFKCLDHTMETRSRARPSDQEMDAMSMSMVDNAVYSVSFHLQV